MISIVGLGPGNPKYMTYEAYNIIKNKNNNIIAFRRAKEGLIDLNENIISIDRVSEVLEYAKKEEEFYLLASGDPNFYGIVEYIKRQNIKINQIIPGISSFQYMMSKLQKAWHNAELLSLHGRVDDLNKVKNKKISIILTDKDNNPQFISKELEKKGIKGKIYTGYDLSYEDEMILENNIGDDIFIKSPLAIVVVENEKMD